MFRSVFLTFHGKFRGTHEQEHHLHESPPSMTVPLWILAAGAVVAGFVGVAEGARASPTGSTTSWRRSSRCFRAAGRGAEHEMSAGMEWVLILIALAVAVAGIFTAWQIYGGDRGAGQGAGRGPSASRASTGCWPTSTTSTRSTTGLIVRPLAALSRFFWKVVDTFVIDGAINAGAFVTELAGDVARFTTTGNVRNYALYFFLGVILLFGWIAFG